ncbi:LacI family DNA-binding transcriptional regulator [Paenibacillus endoradicis]|uniref:LacI family DNA-binding transcriptional regulator n=1 Tax=Paenibacillus endoradicis TaxID=2972487 RepID=UPI002158C898|nr:LacI family DNA-binding transcriptional regulator [Paenibacillus endoradicis]MCR8659644.1 LacI family DNA-binding transcriptional regulator [Paenibacillus endoradicis]
MRNKITIQDIANEVGMSKYAVSRALSGKSGVSPETRQYIVQSAEQLGYFKEKPLTKFYSPTIEIPLDSWTGTGTILVLFPNIPYQDTESLYWGPLFNGISTRLNQKGVNILTLTEPPNDSIFSLLNPDAIKGIVTLGSISTSILLEIQSLNIPMIMVDHLDSNLQCDTVFSDNTIAMQQIMQQLIHDGYRKYQFIGRIKEAQSFKERWLAYRTALEEHDIELNQNPILITPTLEHIHDAILEAVQKDGLPEVFVCTNDTTAMFTIEVLNSIGLQVPRDCILTGFDYTYPELPLYATVNVNKEIIGSRAVDQLFWRIMNPNQPYERKSLSADLILNKQYSKALQKT